jgi:nucleoside 2-deoxyribosyltransferase
VPEFNLHVAGGVYVELCLQPLWDQLYGSAGRAARALSTTDASVMLHTYTAPQNHRQIEILTRGWNVALAASPIAATTSFRYVHPLSVPTIVPAPYVQPLAAPLNVVGDVVLRFGILEGDAVVTGGRVVYDPQSAYNPLSFTANGSTAKTLAIVANANEVRRLSMSMTKELEAAARVLLKQESAAVVVVKRGSKGALVVTATTTTEVPAYRGASVFSIGSGDIFAAAFTRFWGLEEMDPTGAADLASRATARYCESRDPSIPSAQNLQAEWSNAITATHGKVYLAGPFFTIAHRWLVEEARIHLREMDLDVFSPLHDVGVGTAAEVAPKDLAAFTECDRVLALVDGADPGTIFEVGYARARGLPVVALAETLSEENLKMIEGSGCVIVNDFATAIYYTAWCR